MGTTYVRPVCVVTWCQRLDEYEQANIASKYDLGLYTTENGSYSGQDLSAILLIYLYRYLRGKINIQGVMASTFLFTLVPLSPTPSDSPLAATAK